MSKDITLLEEISEQDLVGAGGGIGVNQCMTVLIVPTLSCCIKSITEPIKRKS